MKPTLLFATLSMVFAAPTAFAKSELETLRSLCQEQERQIRQLEDENTKLRSDSGGSHSRPVSAASILSSATQTQTIANPTAATASTYTVKAGDSLEKIARKMSTSPEKLAKANDLKTNSVIHPGQKLKLPNGTAPATAAAPPSPKTNDKTHTVQAGETFSSISKKHRLSAEALAAANPTVKATALRPGQVLNLRADVPVTAPVAPTKPPVAPAKLPEPVAKAPVAPAKLPEPVAKAPVAPAKLPEPVAKAPDAPAKPPEPVAKAPSIPAPTPAAAPSDKKIHPIAVDTEMTYGAFAAQHGTNIERLNALNGLDLTDATVLAKGSELYVPTQP